MAHQVFQQRELFGCQLNGFTAAFDGALGLIERQISNGQFVIMCQRRPPQECPDAGSQLIDGKWLDQIVIGTDVQTKSFVFGCTERRQ